DECLPTVEIGSIGRIAYIRSRSASEKERVLYGVGHDVVRAGIKPARTIPPSIHHDATLLAMSGGVIHRCIQISPSVSTGSDFNVAPFCQIAHAVAVGIVD